MNQIEIVKQEDMTLSQLVWLVLGAQPPTFVETILAANPGLAAAGAFLPVGTTVKLPLDEVPTEDFTEQAVRLWD
jgi:phage tail protein X